MRGAEPVPVRVSSGAPERIATPAFGSQVWASCGVRNWRATW